MSIAAPLQIGRLGAMKAGNERVIWARRLNFVAPVEQRPPEMEVKRRSRDNAYAWSREADATPDRPRQKARFIALLLMIASSIVALTVLYEAWQALRVL